MKSKMSLLLALCCALMLVAQPAFALKTGAVESMHIMAADGTTGQDTNNGSGIKTGHIQDGAVTDAKISGLIAASKIDTEGLNADMIDGLHGSDFAPVVHEHSQADVVGLDTALAAKADATHNHDALYQGKYANVVVVAKSGGDFTSIQAAFDSVSPTVADPVLIKVMPGTYNENIYIAEKNNFHLQGAGEGTSVISGVVGVETLRIHNSTNFVVSDLTIKQTSFNHDQAMEIVNCTEFSVEKNSFTGDFVDTTSMRVRCQA